jgi:hypothetical protein
VSVKSESVRSGRMSRSGEMTRSVARKSKRIGRERMKKTRRGKRRKS